MTDLVVTEARYPTPDEVRALLLNYLRIGYAKAGMTVNVAKGSDLWHRADAHAKPISIAISNGQLGLRDIDPFRVVGPRLVALCAVFGVTPRPAQGSSGYVIASVTGGGTVTVPAGYEWVSPDGLVYAVPIETSNIGDGDLVPVSAVDTGARTDQAAGTIGRWSSASVASLQQTAVVDAEGLDGGTDADGDEELRARLFRRLSFPQGGGNWAQVAAWAEASSAAISYAAIYPTMHGPSSYEVAIVGNDADPVLASTVQAGAAAAVLAEHPGNVRLGMTSVQLEQLDAVIDIGLPLPIAAGGTGGGFVDASPWPSNQDSVLAQVTATSGTGMTVSSTSADPPVEGSRFDIWDPVNEVMLFFSASSVTGSSGAYVITVDTSQQSQLANVQVGAYVSAHAERLSTYASQFLAAMKAMGPGEKSDSPDVLKYARRRPKPGVERPYELTTKQLLEVNANGEVSNVLFAARLATGTSTTLKVPTVPSIPTEPPRQLRLKHLAFRRAV